jgi:thiol-disulfide isomerase/thioredoxin
MEKWKIGAILAMLVALGGYGWYSSQPQAAPPPLPDPTPAPSEPEAPSLVGKPLPNWDIPAGLWTNTSKPITPADLKGSVALVEFFRIGCSHCQEAAPFMEQTYKKYASRGLKMVAIQSPSTGDPEENDWLTVKNRVKQWNLTYPIAFDEGGKLFRETYKMHIFPTVLVVDKDGVVRYFKTGHTAATAKALTDFLEQSLKK